ncbi:hypothetical protein ZWY2020_059835 [Hordeum vulgare]|nr:hypothetical protein ZWY2020_059835 [Hordeum vulgare]
MGVFEGKEIGGEQNRSSKLGVNEWGKCADAPSKQMHQCLCDVLPVSNKTHYGSVTRRVHVGHSHRSGFACDRPACCCM